MVGIESDASYTFPEIGVHINASFGQNGAKCEFYPPEFLDSSAKVEKVFLTLHDSKNSIDEVDLSQRRCLARRIYQNHKKRLIFEIQQTFCQKNDHQPSDLYSVRYKLFREKLHDCLGLCNTYLSTFKDMSSEFAKQLISFKAQIKAIQFLKTEAGKSDLTAPTSCESLQNAENEIASLASHLKEHPEELGPPSPLVVRDLVEDMRCTPFKERLANKGPVAQCLKRHRFP